MEEVLNKIKSSQPNETPLRSQCSSFDVLEEVRGMNKMNIAFFEAMLLEITKLREESVTTKRVDEIETTLQDFKQETENKLSDYETRLLALEEDNVQLKKENERLSEKSLEFECRSRKLNLILGKIEEKPGLNSTESNDELHGKVINMFTNKLGITGADWLLFRNIHRLGKHSARQTKPRNVIVAFIQQPDVDNILQAARETRNNEVSIRTDLPAEYNDMRNALLKIRSEYRDLPEHPIRCRLAYRKFKPVLYRVVPGGDDVEVLIEKGPDGKYHEVIWRQD